MRRDFSRVPHAAITVLVADGDRVLHEQIAALLVESGMVGVIGTALDARSALRAMDEAAPDLVILSASLPGTAELRDGMDVLRWIKQARPHTAVVMLADRADAVARDVALQFGALAYLNKSCELEQLLSLVMM